MLNEPSGFTSYPSYTGETPCPVQCRSCTNCAFADGISNSDRAIAKLTSMYMLEPILDPAAIWSNGRKGRQPRETTYNGERPSDRYYMKRALLSSLAAFLLSSCSPSEQERANEKAREWGREMQREAAHASDQLKHGVEVLDRK